MMVQSKLTKVSFNSSGNPKLLQNESGFFFLMGVGLGATSDVAEHVPKEVSVVLGQPCRDLGRRCPEGMASP